MAVTGADEADGGGGDARGRRLAMSSSTLKRKASETVANSTKNWGQEGARGLEGADIMVTAIAQDIARTCLSFRMEGNVWTPKVGRGCLAWRGA